MYYFSFMIKPFCGTMAVFVLVLIAACRTTKESAKLGLPGTWQEHGIVVDGRNNDWPSPYPFADTHARIMYAVSNDRDKLYVTVETRDTRTKLKILNAGMKLWIDTTGARSQGMALDYPITVAKAQLPNDRTNAGITDREKRLQQRAKTLVDSAKQAAFYGFKNCNAMADVMADNSCGIKVRVAINDTNNNLVWEAAIPFKAIYGKQHIERGDEGRPTSICFDINGFEAPEMIRNMEEKIKKAGAASGDNKAEASRIASRFSEVKALFETSSTWKQFGLAYQSR